MNLEELKDEIHYLFNPEPDDDGSMFRELPHPKLRSSTNLDFSYLETFAWEGSSIHQHTWHCPDNEERIHILTKNSDVPARLFDAALHIFADSIVAYHNSDNSKGQLRYYPSVILTFWSGFETFIRYSSELLIVTAKNISSEITNFLQEKEPYVDKKGDIVYRSKYQAPLDRYAVLLKYGYEFNVERGSKYWQDLEKAKKLRDYYTHLDINEPRGINTSEVIKFLESVLLSIIWPSALLKRTIFLGVYHLHGILMELSKLATNYVEQPLNKDWPSQGDYVFHCNFVNVDTKRFPNSTRHDLSNKST